MKNLAFLYRGKPDELTSLESDCNAIKELLDSSPEWKVVKNKELKSESKLKEDLLSFCNEDIGNLFLYYTGHAVRNGQRNQTLKLLLFDDEYDAKIFIDSIFESFNRLPKRIVIILDACYSGKFINYADRLDNRVELICSSLEHLTSSSRNKASGLSFFTHHFCEAVQKLSLDNDEVNFRNIATHINSKNEQQCIYSPPNIVQNSEIVLTRDRTLYEDLVKLSGKFESFQEMKKGLLEYVPTDHLSFQELIEANTYQKLYFWLVKNKECLYCLFKIYKIEIKGFLETCNNDCSKRKKEALKTKLIKTIVLKIVPSGGTKSLDNCQVEGWLLNNIGQYSSKLIDTTMNFVSKKDAKKKQQLYYESELPKEVVKILQDKNYALLELNLILDESLFEIDFTSLILEIDDDDPSFIEYFKINFQFAFRYHNVDKSISKITTWKLNSDKYIKHQEEKLAPLIYPLSNEESNKLFGRRFNKENANYILLQADYPLLNEHKDIKNILNGGIPHIVCPKDSVAACHIENLDKKLVKEMKSEVFDCIEASYENDILKDFIYDDYYKAEAFCIANGYIFDTNYDDIR